MRATFGKTAIARQRGVQKISATQGIDPRNRTQFAGCTTNTRLALKLFGLFWVGFFVLGFLLGRYHYQADGAVSPLIYRTMSYEMHGETGGGQIEFSCPGSGTLFRYVLDERKLIPDEISISYFVDGRLPTISSIQVPKVDISIASGVFGALGVGPLFKIFTGGGDIKVQEGIIVALAFLSSGPIGYYVGYSVVPTGCPEQKSLIRKLREPETWKTISSKLFAIYYEEMAENCVHDQQVRLLVQADRNVTCFSGMVEGISPYQKAHCSMPLSSADFKWIRDTRARCLEVR